jgi:hypothetical protein
MKSVTKSVTKICARYSIYNINKLRAIFLLIYYIEYYYFYHERLKRLMCIISLTKEVKFDVVTKMVTVSL